MEEQKIKNADILECKICNYKTDKLYNLNRHNNTITHLEKKNFQTKQKYICINCNYNTNNLNDFKRHNKTNKHKKQLQNNNQHICICGKSYKYNSGLYKHKIKCSFVEPEPEPEPEPEQSKTKFQDNMGLNVDIKEILFKILEQNTDLIGVVKDSGNNSSVNHSHNTNNSHNQTVNIMNFLNTECKDAFNLTDFIEQITYTFDDLMNLKDEGWYKNVNNTFIKQLKDLDIYKRPIHCSDKKRKKFYVKENDIWNKDKSNQIIQKGISKFHNKQSKVYIKWKQTNKHLINNNSNVQDDSMYMNMQLCTISIDNGEKIKQKIINDLSDFNIPKR